MISYPGSPLTSSSMPRAVLGADLLELLEPEPKLKNKAQVETSDNFLGRIGPYVCPWPILNCFAIIKYNFSASNP